MMTTHALMSRPMFGGQHRLAYTEWGDPHSRHVVVCVHGLTRTSRDFDFLAAALEAHCRVICLDVVGRGVSDWLAHPQHYGYPVYVRDAYTLIKHVAPASQVWPRMRAHLFGSERVIVDWVGTSMGGLIGMVLAAFPFTPIRRLVLNDVGPFIPAAALERIGSYVGLDPRFQSVEEIEIYFRKIAAPFGPLTDAQWRHLAVHSARRCDDGRYRLHYDPDIAVPLRGMTHKDVDLWPVWKRTQCDTLLLRGAASDVLTADTARAMAASRGNVTLVEFAGIGHAPTLMADDQINIVRDFLLAP